MDDNWGYPHEAMDIFDGDLIVYKFKFQTVSTPRCPGLSLACIMAAECRGHPKRQHMLSTIPYIFAA